VTYWWEFWCFIFQASRTHVTHVPGDEEQKNDLFTSFSKGMKCRLCTESYFPLKGQLEQHFYAAHLKQAIDIIGMSWYTIRIWFFSYYLTNANLYATYDIFCCLITFMWTLLTILETFLPVLLALHKNVKFL